MNKWSGGPSGWHDKDLGTWPTWRSVLKLSAARSKGHGLTTLRYILFAFEQLDHSIIHYWTVILNQPPMSVVLPAHTLQWKMQCSISSVLRSEKLHNFGQLIIKLEIDNQNILSLMIGKIRTMWNLVANHCTQYFQNKLNPLMMSSLLMTYHMSSQCMLVSLLLMTWHTYLLFSGPHIVRLSIHFVLYIQVYTQWSCESTYSTSQC